jgi:hypothetical protein
MELSWNTFITHVKDIGILLGIIVAIFAVRNHWKTLFCPHEKKIDDLEFSSIETLIRSVRNYNFLFIYSAKDDTIDLGILKNLIQPIADQAASPFLPEKISKACNIFFSEFIKSTNYLMIILLKEGKVDDSDKVTILNKKDIFESHKNLNNELIRHLNLRGLTFLFELKE